MVFYDAIYFIIYFPIQLQGIKSSSNKPLLYKPQTCLLMVPPLSLMRLKGPSHGSKIIISKFREIQIQSKQTNKTK
jgi:hypothetical protein